MKTIPFRKAAGKTLQWVINFDRQCKQLKTETQIPDDKHLFNFDVRAGDETWLVLDPYGDESLPTEVRRRLFHEDGSTRPIAIDRSTGEVGSVSFHQEKIGFTMWYSSFLDGALRVPKKFLPRLDDLKCQKRPFCLSVDDQTLLSFITQESSYEDLRQALTVTLWFAGAYTRAGKVKPDVGLLLRSRIWRTISEWQG